MSNPKVKSHSKYKVLQLLGQGCFGKVAKCKNRVTKEVVAMKVMKKNQNANYFFIEELKMLQRISQLDPDTFNLIKFIEHFEFDGHQCMAFQILDRSVEDQMKKQSKFSLSEIRPMTKQLLVALLGLKTIGVMHTDIKSDNIMLVDQEKHPFKVKLIDFGVAMERVEVKQGMQLQPVAFRSPEVSLGLPLSEAVDMWSLACCLIFWLVSFLGTPSEEMLNEGLLKFPHMSFILPQFKDREAFCDLLKKMFELDPYKRITPAEALLHPYITMEHLPHGDGYSQAAKDLMSVAETDYFSLQRQYLERVVQSEQEERAKRLATRKPANPKPRPLVIQPSDPETSLWAEQNIVEYCRTKIENHNYLFLNLQYETLVLEDPTLLFLHGGVKNLPCMFHSMALHLSNFIGGKQVMPSGKLKVRSVESRSLLVRIHVFFKVFLKFN
uniref:Protein kinase domain-containing protein n=1 Tax=Periophthalmus magnuspinnatus TaxID=409849 RepID=A0A3B4AC63_9GOBI